MIKWVSPGNHKPSENDGIKSRNREIRTKCIRDTKGNILTGYLGEELDIASPIISKNTRSYSGRSASMSRISNVKRNGAKSVPASPVKAQLAGKKEKSASSLSLPNSPQTLKDPYNHNSRHKSTLLAKVKNMFKKSESKRKGSSSLPTSPKSPRLSGKEKDLSPNDIDEKTSKSRLVRLMESKKKQRKLIRSLNEKRDSVDKHKAFTSIGEGERSGMSLNTMDVDHTGKNASDLRGDLDFEGGHNIRTFQRRVHNSFEHVPLTTFSTPPKGSDHGRCKPFIHVTEHNKSRKSTLDFVRNSIGSRKRWSLQSDGSVGLYENHVMTEPYDETNSEDNLNPWEWNADATKIRQGNQSVIMMECESWSDTSMYRPDGGVVRVIPFDTNMLLQARNALTPPNERFHDYRMRNDITENMDDVDNMSVTRSTNGSGNSRSSSTSTLSVANTQRITKSSMRNNNNGHHKKNMTFDLSPVDALMPSRSNKQPNTAFLSDKLSVRHDRVSALEKDGAVQVTDQTLNKNKCRDHDDKTKTLVDGLLGSTEMILHSPRSVTTSRSSLISDDGSVRAVNISGNADESYNTYNECEYVSISHWLNLGSKPINSPDKIISHINIESSPESTVEGKRDGCSVHMHKIKDVTTYKHDTSDNDIGTNLEEILNEETNAVNIGDIMSIQQYSHKNELGSIDHCHETNTCIDKDNSPVLESKSILIDDNGTFVENNGSEISVHCVETANCEYAKSVDSNKARHEYDYSCATSKIDNISPVSTSWGSENTSQNGKPTQLEFQLAEKLPIDTPRRTPGRQCHISLADYSESVDSWTEFSKILAAKYYGNSKGSDVTSRTSVSAENNGCIMSHATLLSPHVDMAQQHGECDRDIGSQCTSFDKGAPLVSLDKHAIEMQSTLTSTLSKSDLKTVEIEQVQHGGTKGNQQIDASSPQPTPVSVRHCLNSTAQSSHPKTQHSCPTPPHVESVLSLEDTNDLVTTELDSAGIFSPPLSFEAFTLKDIQQVLSPQPITTTENNMANKTSVVTESDSQNQMNDRSPSKSENESCSMPILSPFQNKLDNWSQMSVNVNEGKAEESNNVIPETFKDYSSCQEIHSSLSFGTASHTNEDEFGNFNQTQLPELSEQTTEKIASIETSSANPTSWTNLEALTFALDENAMTSMSDMFVMPAEAMESDSTHDIERAEVTNVKKRVSFNLQVTPVYITSYASTCTSSDDLAIIENSSPCQNSPLVHEQTPSCDIVATGCMVKSDSSHSIEETKSEQRAPDEVCHHSSSKNVKEPRYSDDDSLMDIDSLDESSKAVANHINLSTNDDIVPYENVESGDDMHVASNGCVDVSNKYHSSCTDSASVHTTEHQFTNKDFGPTKASSTSSGSKDTHILPSMDDVTWNVPSPSPPNLGKDIYQFNINGDKQASISDDLSSDLSGENHHQDLYLVGSSYSDLQESAQSKQSAIILISDPCSSNLIRCSPEHSEFIDTYVKDSKAQTVPIDMIHRDGVDGLNDLHDNEGSESCVEQHDTSVLLSTRSNEYGIESKHMLNNYDSKHKVNHFRDSEVTYSISSSHDVDISIPGSREQRSKTFSIGKINSNECCEDTDGPDIPTASSDYFQTATMGDIDKTDKTATASKEQRCKAALQPYAYSKQDDIPCTKFVKTNMTVKQRSMLTDCGRNILNHMANVSNSDLTYNVRSRKTEDSLSSLAAGDGLDTSYDVMSTMISNNSDDVSIDLRTYIKRSIDVDQPKRNDHKLLPVQTDVFKKEYRPLSLKNAVTHRNHEDDQSEDDMTKHLLDRRSNLRRNVQKRRQVGCDNSPPSHSVCHSMEHNPKHRYTNYSAPSSSLHRDLDWNLKHSELHRSSRYSKKTGHPLQLQRSHAPSQDREYRRLTNYSDIEESNGSQGEDVGSENRPRRYNEDSHRRKSVKDDLAISRSNSRHNFGDSVQIYLGNILAHQPPQWLFLVTFFMFQFILGWLFHRKDN